MNSISLFIDFLFYYCKIFGKKSNPKKYTVKSMFENTDFGDVLRKFWKSSVEKLLLKLGKISLKNESTLCLNHNSKYSCVGNSNAITHIRPVCTVHHPIDIQLLLHFSKENGNRMALSHQHTLTLWLWHAYGSF